MLGSKSRACEGTGSLAAQILSTGPSSGSIERINSDSTISQRRITAGVERDLPHGQTLGFFYRYGLIEAADNDTSHTLNNLQDPLDSTRSSGHSSEFGLRLRGPLGRRFFYGVEASWLGLALSDDLTRSITVDSHQRDRAQRSSAALGLGYFLNPRTVLSVDFAGGTSPASTSRTEIGTGDSLLQTGIQNSRFVSANLGVQTKVSSHLFLNASLLAIWQAYDLSQAVYPGSFGNTVLITDPFLPLTATGYRPPRRLLRLRRGVAFFQPTSCAIRVLHVLRCRFRRPHVHAALHVPFARRVALRRTISRPWPTASPTGRRPFASRLLAPPCCRWHR